MDHLTAFVTNHWQLWLALVVLLIAIVAQEWLAQKNRAKELSPAAVVHAMNHDEAVVLDMRDANAFRQGHIIGAIRIEPNGLNEQQMKKYNNKPLIFVCTQGVQAKTLAAKMRQSGFTNSTVLAGGITAWQAAGLPLIKG